LGKRIAVIGSGISGMAAAYYLSRKHHVWLFEREPRLGGHTHTIEIETSRGPLPVDTGFIVHNDRTYPNLIRLFAELGVETQPSDMSFSVSCQKTGFEFSSRGANGFFAQRSNLLRAGHYGLFLEILRFNREAPELLDGPESLSIKLREFLDARRFSHRFRERYLYPMASAVWSTAPERIGDFPAATLVRFFHNHGMLGVRTHPQWKAIRGGSHRYIEPLTRPYRERVVAGAGIRAVRRRETGVELHFAERPAMTFDEVVFACNGPRTLALLESPTPAERDILQSFRVNRNPTWLHTDASLLPRRRNARASWNYHMNGDGHTGVAVTYHMNRLQSLPPGEDYCVTLNPNGEIDPARVLRKLVYEHPLYTLEAVRAQARWAEISGRNRTHFCGAYWFYGFHEDGLNSAWRVARALEANP
jgi:predicted NAD/FAD-binding protein